MHSEVTYCIRPDGEIVVTTVSRVRQDAAWLPRFGFELQLTGDMDYVTYYAKGPEENYIDLCHNVKKGLFSTKVDQDYVPKAFPQDFAERAVQEGYCAVVLEQRYMGTSGQTEKGAPLCARKNAALPALLLGRTAIGERVWDVQRLLDVLEKHFTEYVDIENILCMGNSGGGTTTFYAACVDDRIKLAMPSCSVCEFDDSIISKHHCCCNYIPGIRRYFEMGDLAGLIADRKLVMVCGVLDPDFPVNGVEKSYERAQQVFRMLEREACCRLVKGPAGHQFYPELAWPVANELMMGKRE